MNLDFARGTGSLLIDSVFGAGYTVWLMGRAFGYATPAQIWKRRRNVLTQGVRAACRASP